MRGVVDDLHSYVVSDAGDNYESYDVLAADELEEWRRTRLTRMLDRDDVHVTTVGGSGHPDAFAITVSKPADSAVLGVRVGALEVIAVRDGSQNLERMAMLLAAVRSDLGASVDLLTALVDGRTFVINEALQLGGSRVYGANASWVSPASEVDRSLLAAEAPHDEHWYQPDERDDLLRCVADSYSTYRSHYHADVRLAASDCSASYVESVARHVDAGGAVATICDDEGIAAFCTIDPHVEINEHLGRPQVASVETAGVARRARRSAMYEATMIMALRRIVDDGHLAIEYGCVPSNVAVQRIYIKLGGFRPRQYSLRHHLWLDE